jgi:uncharacterized membrane protein
MLNLLKKYDRLYETIFLGMLSLSCVLISVFRMIYTKSPIFLFLNWNLFLAFLPWFFSILLIVKPRLQSNKLLILILLLSWLLFFPNAPYILTDLFHLQLQLTMPKWFDLMLILSFAWTGLLFGFISLWNIEKTLSKTIDKRNIPFISSGFLFLASFGVYLGRYLRWNSWDIVIDPFNLLNDIQVRFTKPFDYLETWGMTILMGIFLNMVYWSFRILIKRIYLNTIH